MNQLVPVIVLYNWNGPKYTSNILFIYVSNRLMNRGSCIVFLICRKTIVKCKILITNADLTVTDEYWISYMHLATNWQCRGVSMTWYTPVMILLHSWHCYIRFYKYHITNFPFNMMNIVFQVWATMIGWPVWHAIWKGHAQIMEI